MKKNDVLKMSKEFFDFYFSDNVEQMYKSIFGGVSDTDDLKTATWKMVVSSSEYACRTAVMTTLCFLIDLGVIECDDSDTPTVPLSWEVLPQ